MLHIGSVYQPHPIYHRERRQLSGFEARQYLENCVSEWLRLQIGRLTAGYLFLTAAILPN